MRTILGLVVCVLAIGCSPRELSWLVPRATIRVAVTRSEGRIDGSGMVLLATPTERSPRRGRLGRSMQAPRLETPRAVIPCVIVEACRWERRETVRAWAELVEGESPMTDREEE